MLLLLHENGRFAVESEFERRYKPSLLSLHAEFCLSSLCSAIRWSYLVSSDMYRGFLKLSDDSGYKTRIFHAPVCYMNLKLIETKIEMIYPLAQRVDEMAIDRRITIQLGQNDQK